MLCYRQDLLTFLSNASQSHYSYSFQTFDVRAIVSALKPEDPVLPEQLGEPQRFALVIYFRWVLRSLSRLRLPFPVGPKAHVYTSLSRNTALPMQSLVGVDQATNDALMAQGGVSVKALELIVEQKAELTRQPDVLAFKTVGDKLVISQEPSEWRLLPSKADWNTIIQLDLALYYLCVEGYTPCGAIIDSLPEKVKRGEVEIDPNRRGLLDSVSGGTDSSDPPPFCDSAALNFDTVDKLAGKPDTPSYWNAHYELSASYYGAKKAGDISRKNLVRKIDECLPGNYDSYQVTGFSAQDEERSGKFQLFKYLQDDDDDEASESKSSRRLAKQEPEKRPDFSVKMYDGKQKMPKIRKRHLLQTIFKTERPEKLQRLISDLGKLVPVRRASTRWSIDVPDNMISALSRGKDSDYEFVLLCKMLQLLKAGGIDESRALQKAFAEKDKNPKPHLAPVLKDLQFRILSAELEECFREKESVDDDLFMRCGEVLTQLHNHFTDVDTAHLNNCLVALINRGEWELVLSLSEPRWGMLRVSHALVSIAAVIKGGGGDLKKSTKQLQDLVAPLLKPVPKRAREGSAAMSAASGIALERSNLLAFISKISHPDVLAVLGSLFVFFYNIGLDDSTLKIIDNFPQLPFIPAAAAEVARTSMPPDSYLAIFSRLRSRADPQDPAWTRLAAEANFSVGNHSTALKFYLQSLVAQYHFMTRGNLHGDADDRVFGKMTKSLTQLEQHALAAALCQCLSETDYTMAFKGLEERGSADAMDALYPMVWDTTILEYAVSMHTKKGEASRRRAALESISDLQINTNNNIEILREVALTKRATLIRGCCQKFL